MSFSPMSSNTLENMIVLISLSVIKYNLIINLIYIIRLPLEDKAIKVRVCANFYLFFILISDSFRDSMRSSLHFTLSDNEASESFNFMVVPIN